MIKYSIEIYLGVGILTITLIWVLLHFLEKRKEEKKKEFNEEAVERKWKNRAFHFGENEKKKNLL